MTTLFLNIASHAGCIAVADATAVLALTDVHPKTSDADLLPLLDRTLRDAGKTPQDLHRIACVIGPGGFTSLRIAVTLANTLADQLDVPLAGIHLSDLLRARSSADAVWLHSTKAQLLFLRDAGDAPPVLLPLHQLPSRLPSGGDWCGELLPAHRVLVEEAGVREAALRPLEAVMPEVLASLSYAKTPLEPWYGRDG